MVALPSPDLHVVTYHAVKRYIQRVLGIYISKRKKLANEKERATAHCRAAGMTIDQVRAVILQPHVIRAMSNQLSAVRTDGFIAVIGSNGVVLTIYRDDSRHARKTREQTKRQARAQSHQYSRRRKKHRQTISQTEVEP